MCSYITQIASISGQGAGPNGWFDLNQANVYFDHPFHAPLDHAVTVDFVNPTMGPSARVAIELSADSAERLMQLIDASILASTSGNYETPGAIEDQQSDNPQVKLFGSGKGRAGWLKLEKAMIYNSVDQTSEQTIHIDFLSKQDSNDNSRNISIDVTTDSAEAISRSIDAALENGRREHIL